jgi:hypothetical protein
MQRQLWFGPTADDHAAAGGETLDEGDQTRCRRSSELEVVDHHRLTEVSELVEDRYRNVVEVGFPLGEQVDDVEPYPTERGTQRQPKRHGIRISGVTREPD